MYLDDIIVIGPDFFAIAFAIRGHLRRLREDLCHLQMTGLKLKPSKCTLVLKKVRDLGHVVSGEGVAADPEKLVAVWD